QDGVDRRNPTNRARHINVVKDLLAAVPFEVDEQSVTTSPGATRFGQRAQQRGVHVSAVGARDFLQKRTRLSRVERHLDRACRLDRVWTSSVDWQLLEAGVFQAQPVRQLLP